MGISPAQQPDDDSTVAGSNVSGSARGSETISGTRTGNTDPTNEPGQLGHAMERLLGMPPDSWTRSAAPGTQGATYSSDSDPTNQPGQLYEGISGEGPAQTAHTGAPGTSTPGASTTPYSGGGPDTVTFTNPGSMFAGTYQSEQVSTSVSGPQDWTQANDEGYATGGPQLPGIKGNEPQAQTGPFQPGQGRVLRGGRAVNP